MNIEQKLESLKPAIRTVVSKLHSQYGGQREDMLTDAMSAAALAIKKFDPAKATCSLKIFVCRLVWQELFEDVRIRARRSRLAKFQNLEPESMSQIVDEKESIDISSRALDCLDEISDGAMAVAEFILSIPTTNPLRMQGQIRSYFRRQNWKPIRIQAAMEELRGALS